MGQSIPTTTMALDTFTARYREFRAELHPREQEWFDRLVERARRHSSAINRRPHMDFERPVMLAMLMEGMRELDEVHDELRATRKQLTEACHALADAGLVVRRVPTCTPEQLGRLGQTRLDCP
jgi:hypothetical protein